MVIEEEWFSDISLTNDATFPEALIKRANSIFNQKIKFPRDPMLLVHKNAIKSGCNTQVVQILCEERGGKIHSKGNMLSRLIKPVELSHEWVLTNFKYQEQSNAYLQLK